MTAATAEGSQVGVLLRQWRTRRRLSQLELSSRCATSTRHLSFVETGRSRPSSDMILRLSEQLDVPLRDRNRLLLAGGFAPLYPEQRLDHPSMAPSLAAVRQVLDAHAPNPALAVDQGWTVLDTNDSVGILTGLVTDPALLDGEINALRLSLHPAGIAPHIVNLGQWRGHVLGRLRRHAELRADPALHELYAELAAYPCAQEEPAFEQPESGGVHVPFRIRIDGHVRSFLAIITTFGTALDITLEGLSIESFFPADSTTAIWLNRMSRRDRRLGEGRWQA